MSIIIGILTLSLLLLSCGNKRKQEYSSTFIETPRDESYQQQDSIVVEEVKTSSSSISSVSCHSHESSGYDNMRGFDPASEDDMEDSGISRYMDNNDEKGWK